MDRMRLTMCLKKLNEAHEHLTSSGSIEYTASDLRLLDAIDATIQVALEVMASNRANERMLGRGNH